MDRLKRFFDSLKTPYREGLELYGHFSVSVYDVKRGKRQRIRRFTKKNQITDLGRIIHLELFGQWVGGTVTQANPDKNSLYSIWLGTDGTPPSAGDTQVIAPVHKAGLFDGLGNPYFNVLVTDPYEIWINRVFDPGDITPGLVLAEAGLYSKGDGLPLIGADPNRRLYARQTHPSFEITPTMSVTYDWRLGMTVQV